jgi:putative NIF3 family GTP cyclohydrolase 1 type 2
MTPLRDLVASLDTFFGIAAVGPDPGFSRFIPRAYGATGYNWRAVFERRFTELFNGLMLRGADEVQTVFCSAFPAAEVLDEFIETGRPGDLLFLHHPLYIESGDPRGEPGRGFLPIDPRHIDAIREKRLSFYSCHAPLDAHPDVGTTAAMVDALGGRPEDAFWPYGSGHAGVICSIAPVARHELITQLLEIFGLPYADVDGGHPASIRRVAVVAGAGYKVEHMREAEGKGAQAYITGEIHTRIIGDDYGRGSSPRHVPLPRRP